MAAVVVTVTTGSGAAATAMTAATVATAAAVAATATMVMVAAMAAVYNHTHNIPPLHPFLVAKSFYILFLLFSLLMNTHLICTYTHTYIL